jgi:glycosyltransferase involved in cell wall biosynthesis
LRAVQGRTLKNAIVIPAYNEATTIADVTRAVQKYGYVIVVDDGSTDLTVKKAEMYGADVVKHTRNFGYDAAIQSGFERAKELGMDTVITFDADGQHDPAVIPRFLELLHDENKDLVVGIRKKGARISEAVFNLYAKIRFGAPDILCGVKGYQIDLYRRLGWFSSYESIGTELALYGLRNGVQVAFVSTRIDDRSDRPRFASGINAEIRILRSLWKAIIFDFTR